MYLIALAIIFIFLYVIIDRICECIEKKKGENEEER